MLIIFVKEIIKKLPEMIVNNYIFFFSGIHRVFMDIMGSWIGKITWSNPENGASKNNASIDNKKYRKFCKKLKLSKCSLKLFFFSLVISLINQPIHLVSPFLFQFSD